MNKKILIFIFFFFLSFMVSISNFNALEDYENTFTYYTNGDDTHVIYTSHYFPIPVGATYFNMYIPYTRYSNILEDSGNEFKSLIKIYNSDHTQIDTIDLSTYVGGMDSDNGYWYWDDLTVDGQNLLDGSYFQLEFIQTYAGHASPSYLDFFNREFEYAFDETIDSIAVTGAYEVTYYVGDYIWYKSRYEMGGIPVKPIDPFYTNLYFLGWYNEEGIKYDFTPIPFDDYGADNLILSARFKFQTPQGIDGMIDNTPAPLEHILTVTGFNNTIGKIMIYVVLLLITTGLLLWIKLDSFIIIIVEIILFGVFIFLGWLPIYVIVILGLLFGTGLLKSLSKGGS